MRHLSLSLIAAAGLALAACSDDPAAGTDATADATQATDTTADSGTDTAPDASGGCATGLASSMSGRWAFEETQTALVQVDPFGTMTQVSTSLYLAELSSTGAGTVTMTLCDWQTKDDANLFTTRMGDTVLANLDPFVRDLHVTAKADGTVGFTVDEGISLRGVALTTPATEALPTEASDSRVVDQDEDGSPGISLVVNGALQGKLYVLHRHRAALDGCFTSADSIEGLTDWTTEQNILGSNPTALAESKPIASTHPDKKLSHFRAVKVGDADDCAAIVGKRDTLF